MTEKRYSNNDITVIWKPDICIHSKKCWKGLQDVFDPTRRPWIKMDSAGTQQIMDQVNQCPSGALSFVQNNAAAGGAITTAVPEESKKEIFPVVEVTANGPLLINSTCVVRHADGTEEIKKGIFALCRCGASANKPYCDGSHTAKGFEG